MYFLRIHQLTCGHVQSRGHSFRRVPQSRLADRITPSFLARSGGKRWNKVWAWLKEKGFPNLDPRRRARICDNRCWKMVMWRSPIAKRKRLWWRQWKKGKGTWGGQKWDTTYQPKRVLPTSVWSLAINRLNRSSRAERGHRCYIWWSQRRMTHGKTCCKNCEKRSIARRCNYYLFVSGY